jgi:hypothetical protein
VPIVVYIMNDELKERLFVSRSIQELTILDHRLRVRANWRRINCRSFRHKLLMSAGRT